MQYIAGISISLFVAALLFNKKDKAQSDKILLGWMLLNAFHLSVQYTFTTGMLMGFPALYGVLAPLSQLHGVFLYLYVASITNQLPQNKSLIWLHFVPALLIFLYLLRYYLFLPKAEKIILLESKGVGHEYFLAILLSTTILSGVVYVIWSILLLRKHKKNILDRFSKLEKINLKWLRFLIYGFGLLWIVVILAQKDEYIFTVAVMFIILTGYFGLQQIDIFKKRDKKTLNSNTPEKKEKYAKSGLSEEVSSNIYQELIRLMEEEAVYKQQELSIGDLAEILDIHPNYLSQVINEKADQRFYDFINTYRVGAFKKLIAKPENKQFTMLSLAFDCGFNSKSAFNRYFKKVTGHTPSQYLKFHQDTLGT